MYNILILTEAGYIKGFGHFHRMSSIAEGAGERGIKVKMIIDGDETAKENLQRSYTLFAEWQKPGCRFDELIEKNDIVVVDSYHVGLRQLEAIRSCCHDMIVIDDTMRLNYNHMKVLNPNYYAEFLNYPDNQGNTYYLGKHYLLLRKAFHISKKREANNTVNNVLITMGGTDLENETAKCIRVLKSLYPQVKINVVVTSAYEERDIIKSSLGTDDVLHKDITSSEMSGLMELADFSIATAGGTSNELIKMQCPALLKVVAGNQEKNARIMSEQKCIRLMSSDRTDSIKRMFDYNTRAAMIESMKRFASDKGAVDFIISLAMEDRTICTGL